MADQILTCLWKFAAIETSMLENRFLNLPKVVAQQNLEKVGTEIIAIVNGKTNSRKHAEPL